ncbi:MAG: hypothetical protein HY699_15525 [Deltaproteobacteria bacterium]|nr:hypothetical protein [Deltaproteobacteria bacterium]
MPARTSSRRHPAAFAITFRALGGKDLSCVAIQPRPRPVFIKEGQFEHLYIRTGNSTRLLTAPVLWHCWRNKRIPAKNLDAQPCLGYRTTREARDD